jgi:hypothetical protein
VSSDSKAGSRKADDPIDNRVLVDVTVTGIVKSSTDSGTEDDIEVDSSVGSIVSLE